MTHVRVHSLDKGKLFHYWVVTTCRNLLEHRHPSKFVSCSERCDPGEEHPLVWTEGVDEQQEDNPPALLSDYY